MYDRFCSFKVPGSRRCVCPLLDIASRHLLTRLRAPAMEHALTRISPDTLLPVQYVTDSAFLVSDYCYVSEL
jgi:hypothetical protein